jgi:hypothetical protein
VLTYFLTISATYLNKTVYPPRATWLAVRNPSKLPLLVKVLTKTMKEGEVPIIVTSRVIIIFKCLERFYGAEHQKAKPLD